MLTNEQLQKLYSSNKLSDYIFSGSIDTIVKLSYDERDPLHQYTPKIKCREDMDLSAWVLDVHYNKEGFFQYIDILLWWSDYTVFDINIHRLTYNDIFWGDKFQFLFEAVDSQHAVMVNTTMPYMYNISIDTENGIEYIPNSIQPLIIKLAYAYKFKDRVLQPEDYLLVSPFDNEIYGFSCDEFHQLFPNAICCDVTQYQSYSVKVPLYYPSKTANYLRTLEVLTIGSTFGLSELFFVQAIVELPKSQVVLIPDMAPVVYLAPGYSLRASLCTISNEVQSIIFGKHTCMPILIHDIVGHDFNLLKLPDICDAPIILDILFPLNLAKDIKIILPKKVPYAYLCLSTNDASANLSFSVSEITCDILLINYNSDTDIWFPEKVVTDKLSMTVVNSPSFDMSAFDLSANYINLSINATSRQRIFDEFTAKIRLCANMDITAGTINANYYFLPAMTKKLSFVRLYISLLPDLSPVPQQKIIGVTNVSYLEIKTDWYADYDIVLDDIHVDTLCFVMHDSLYANEDYLVANIKIVNSDISRLIVDGKDWGAVQASDVLSFSA